MILIPFAVAIWAGANCMWWLSGLMVAVTVLLGWLQWRHEVGS